MRKERGCTRDIDPRDPAQDDLSGTLVMQTTPHTPIDDQKAILHICRREMLRPLRDQILRLSGFKVDSFLSPTDGLYHFTKDHYDLVLIDVEGESGVDEAEQLCSEIKTAAKEQVVAFVCNWRVAAITDCPDDIIRTEFDPSAFVSGVRNVVAKH